MEMTEPERNQPEYMHPEANRKGSNMPGEGSQSSLLEFDDEFVALPSQQATDHIWD